MQPAGAGVRLRIDHVLQCLSLAGEQVGQHDSGCPRDGAAIQLLAAAAAVSDVRAAIGRLGLLHGQILRDAHQGIRAHGDNRGEGRLGDQIRFRRLPCRAGEANAERHTAARCGKAQPRWSGCAIVAGGHGNQAGNDH